jgi:cytochrome c5
MIGNPLMIRAIACSLLMLGAARAADAPASVSAAGVTLKSVGADLPFGDRALPAGTDVDLVTSTCTGCHSAGMILNQPALSRADWEGEIAKMKAVYKAPVQAADIAAIAAYLAALKPAP